MTSDADVRFGELRGYLEAFADLNGKTNHGYTFEIDRLSPDGSIVDAIKLWVRDKAARVTVEPVDDAGRAAKSMFERWLFEFQDPHGPRLDDTNSDFEVSNDRGRERIIDRLLERIAAATCATSVWIVHVRTESSFYACAWDELAFEGPKGRFILHLSVSD